MCQYFSTKVTTAIMYDTILLPMLIHYSESEAGLHNYTLQDI